VLAQQAVSIQMHFELQTIAAQQACAIRHQQKSWLDWSIKNGECSPASA